MADAVTAARRNFRKALCLIAGTAVVLFGVAIAPLPGPGATVLVPVGLVILATEFIWARRLLRTLKYTTEEMARRGDAAGAKIPRWFLIPIVLGYYAFFAMLYVATNLPRTLVVGTALGLSLPLGVWVYRTLKLVRGRPPGGRAASAEPQSDARGSAASMAEPETEVAGPSVAGHAPDGTTRPPPQH